MASTSVSGTFVSCSGNSMTLSHDGSPNTTHAIAPTASVTIDGATKKLTDLKAGDSVSLSGDPATTVTVTR